VENSRVIIGGGELSTIHWKEQNVEQMSPFSTICVEKSIMSKMYIVAKCRMAQFLTKKIDHMLFIHFAPASKCRMLLTKHRCIHLKSWSKPSLKIAGALAFSRKCIKRCHSLAESLLEGLTFFRMPEWKHVEGPESVSNVVTAWLKVSWRARLSSESFSKVHPSWIFAFHGQVAPNT
jgi:hypothetical protein